MNANIFSSTRTITLHRKDDRPLKFKGEYLGSAGKCEIESDRHCTEFSGAFNLRTSLQLYQTVAGKYVGSVSEFDSTNGHYGRRDAVFANTPEELFKALTELQSEFLREGYINTSVVDGDILRELFANAGLGSEIPAAGGSVEEID